MEALPGHPVQQHSERISDPAQSSAVPGSCSHYHVQPGWWEPESGGRSTSIIGDLRTGRSRGRGCIDNDDDLNDNVTEHNDKLERGYINNNGGYVDETKSASSTTEFVSKVVESSRKQQQQRWRLRRRSSTAFEARKYKARDRGERDCSALGVAATSQQSDTESTGAAKESDKGRGTGERGEQERWYRQRRERSERGRGAEEAQTCRRLDTYCREFGESSQGKRDEDILQGTGDWNERSRRYDRDQGSLNLHCIPIHTALLALKILFSWFIYLLHFSAIQQTTERIEEPRTGLLRVKKEEELQALPRSVSCGVDASTIPRLENSAEVTNSGVCKESETAVETSLTYLVNRYVSPPPEDWKPLDKCYFCLDGKLPHDEQPPLVSLFVSMKTCNLSDGSNTFSSLIICSCFVLFLQSPQSESSSSSRSAESPMSVQVDPMAASMVAAALSGTYPTLLPQWCLPPRESPLIGAHSHQDGSGAGDQPLDLSAKPKNCQVNI